MYKKKIVAFLLVQSMVVSIASGSDDAGKQRMQELRKLSLEELMAIQVKHVYTASRTVEEIKKSAASVTVITEQEIRSMGAMNLADVLRTVPGIGITKNSLDISEVEVRGIKTEFSEKVLFMLNNHPLNNNLVNGGSTWTYGNLPVNNIRRIEVIRGPGSALYGANAFLAVINIFTKEAQDIDGVQLRAGAGNFDTQQYNLLFGKEWGDLSATANFNFFETDGIEAVVERDAQTALDEQMGTQASLAPGRTDDWERRYDAYLSLAYKNLSFQGKYIKREKGSLAGATFALSDDDHQRYEDYFFELKYRHEISSDLDLIAKLYRDQFSFDNSFQFFPEGHRDLFPEGVNARVFAENSRTGAELQANYFWSDANKLIGGALFEHQEQFDVGQKTNFNPITGEPFGAFLDISDRLNWNRSLRRDIWAVYLEDLWDIRDNLRLTLGGRFDHYSDFGGVFSPRIGISWEFIKGYYLKLLYGEAFRAPTFAEQHNINNPALIGNPDIRPEKIATAEVGLGADFNEHYAARITFFHNEIRDLISAVTQSTGVRTHENFGRIDVDGLELEMRASYDKDTYAVLNYTFQSPHSTISGRVPDVPAHKGSAIVNIGLSEHFNFNAQLFLKGSTPRAKGDNRDEVPGYGLVNTSLIARNFLKGLELRASVYNLLDKEYRDPAPQDTLPDDFPRPGRSFFIELHYQL